MVEAKAIVEESENVPPFGSKRTVQYSLVTLVDSPFIEN